MAISVAIFVGVISIFGEPLTLVIFPLYCGFAALFGAFFGVTVATMVSIALILAGPNIRRDRLRSRIVAGAVAAIVAMARGNAAPMPAILRVAIVIGTVLAAVALAPRVAVGKASAARIRDRVSA